MAPRTTAPAADAVRRVARAGALLVALSLLPAAALAAGTAASATPATEPGTTAEAAAQPVSEGVRLLMVEQVGCIYCAAWDREIAPGYANSPEGRAAPLARVMMDGPWPDGLALARKPVLTPTFVLLRDGQELARLEGYPGDQFFWPLLDDLMKANGIPLPQPGS